MKKILILCLFAFTIFAQSTHQKGTVEIDSLINPTVTQVVRDVADLAGGSIITTYSKEAIDQMFASLRGDLDTLAIFTRALAGEIIPVYPYAPYNLDTTKVETNFIAISWDDSTTSPDSFLIEYANLQYDPITPTYAIWGYSTNKTDTISGLIVATPYSIRVRTIKAGVLSAVSNILTVTTDAEPPVGGGGETYLYVSASATGTGDGTVGDPYTLSQARNIVTGDDTVILAPGYYDVPNLPSQDVIIFSRSGTSGHRIVWRGTIADDAAYWADSAADFSETSTVIRCYGQYQDKAIILSGDYQTFENIIMYTATSNNRGLVELHTNNILDSVVVMQNESGLLTSDHTIRSDPGADNIIMRYCRLWGSNKTGIWIESGNSDPCDNLLIENCIIEGIDNHYPIQIMPTTNVSAYPNGISDNAIVRNNLFESTYASQGGIYVRHAKNFQIYNNVFLGESYPLIMEYQPIYLDTIDGEGAIVAHNTSVISIPNGTNYSLHYPRGVQSIDYLNNLFYFSNGMTYLYRSSLSVNGGTYSTLRSQIDYNLYYSPLENVNNGNTRAVTWDGTSRNWTTWLSATGHDANTIIDDNPDFTGSITFDATKTSALNYQLSLGSPAIDAGLTISIANGYIVDIDTDFLGNPRDATPDIGAFEYVGGGLGYNSWKKIQHLINKVKGSSIPVSTLPYTVMELNEL